jgi:hypothetical protein
MKTAISDLNNAQLDYAVAVAQYPDGLIEFE